MSIEKSSLSAGAKAVSGTDLHGKNAGKAPGASGGNGFSALMALLSATDDASASLMTDVSLVDAPLVEKDGLGADVNLADSNSALLIQPFVAPAQTAATLITLASSPTSTFAPAPASAPTSASASASASASSPALVIGESIFQVPSAVTPTLAAEVPQVASMSAQAANASLNVALGTETKVNASTVVSQLVGESLPQFALEPVGLAVNDTKERPLPSAESKTVSSQIGRHTTMVDTSVIQKPALASLTSDTLSVSAVGGQTVADVAQTTMVSALLAQKSTVQAQAISAAQQDFKDATVSAASQLVVPAADASVTLQAESASKTLSVRVVGSHITVDGAQNATVSSLLAQKNAVPVQGGSAAQQDVKVARAFAASELLMPAAEATETLLAVAAGDAMSVSDAGAKAMAEVAQTTTVSALLAQKSAVQAQVINAAQQDFKDARAFAASQSVVPAADASATLLAGSVSELVRPQGRFGARPGFGQSGSSGFEGAFGQAMTATHRFDAVFDVPSTSAAVADTAIAETVSYWASQGVQTAELTLDGFGDSPVEVSILLNGDQAQIDFRTDQEGVRQVLEAATAELKELLSSQGLALAGVSVGTSGKGGDTGGERRSRQDAKEITLVKADASVPVATRAANPAVGRSLDLFV